MSQNNGPISRLLSQSMKDITTGKAKATPKMTPTAADYLLGRVTPPTPQQPPNPIRDQQRANTRAVQGIVPQARLANQGMASGAERKAANEARRANTPGTVENTRELVRRQVTQLPIPQEYRVQVESLIDSALHIRTTYLDPATGLRRRVDPLASGQAIRETGMLDPQDAMAVVELLKTEEGIKQLQAEVQMFRDQRVMGSRRARGTDQNTIGTNNLTSAEQREILAAQDAAMRAGLTLDQFLRTPAGASMDLGNLRRLMGRGENIGLLGQAQAEGKSLEDPTFAGLGAVIDRAAEAAPAIRETHRFLRQNPDALTQGVEGLERASTILGLGGPAVAVTRGVLSAVGIDTDSYFKTLDQFNVAVARGAVEGTSAMVRIPQLLGSQTFADLANLADAAVAARDKQKPLDQTFFNETGRVAGGVIPQVAPALLTGGGSAGASAAARIAASVAFAVTEAGANAAGGYNQAIQKGESPMAARRRVAQAMPADIIWSAVLNRLGEFGEIGEAFAKAGRKSFADALKAGAVRYGSASALEGIQEGGQTILEHYIATGEIDPSRPEVLKSMLLGAAVGGAMKGALDLAPQQAQGAEVVPQRSAAASAPPVAESYQAREKEYQVWEARLEELEALLERASGDTMLPNGMPNPMSKAAIQRMISEHRKSRPAFFVIGESQPSAKPKPRTEPAQMPTREQLAAMNVGAEAGQVGDINALRQLQSEIDEWAAYRRSLGLESDPAQQFAPRLTAQDLEGAYAPDQAEPGVIDRTRLAQAQPPAQEPSNPTPVTQSFESTKEWDPEGSQSIAQWEKDRANAMRENPTGLIDILSQEKKIVNQLVDAVAAITVARKLDHDNSGLDPDKISMAWIARLSDFAKARNIPSRLFAKAIQAARDGYANGGKEFILERAQSAEAKSAADEMIAANAANVRQSELEKYNERRAQAVELGIPDEEIDDVLAVELGVYHPDSTRRFNSYTKEWYEEIDHSLATPNEVSQVSEATPPAGPTIDPATLAQFAQVNQGRAGVPNFPASAEGIVPQQKAAEAPVAQEREPWQMTREEAVAAYAEAANAVQAFGKEAERQTPPALSPKKVPYNVMGFESEAWVLVDGNGKTVSERFKTRAQAVKAIPDAQENILGQLSFAESRGLQSRADALLDRAHGHKGYVEQALKDGLPVPPEVLADYPDLAAKYQPQNTPAKAPESVSPGVQEAEGSTAGVAAEPAQKQPKARTQAQQRADAKKRDAVLQDLVYGTPGTVIEKRGYTDTVVSYDKKQGTVVVSRTEDGRNMGQFTLMGGLDKRDVISITAPDGTVLYDNRKLTDAAKERVEAMLAPTKAKKPAPNVSRNTQFPVQETMAKPETSKRKKSFGEAVTAMLAGDIYGNRAKAGGEVGINDKWYKGGQFLPVSLKGLEESVAKAKRKASGGDRGVEVFGRAYRKLSPTEIPIIEMLSDQHGFRVGAHYGPELDEGYRQTSPPTRPDGKQDRKRIDELKAQKLGRWRKDERTDEWVWEQRESTKGIVRMVENKEFLSQGGFNADDRAPLREWMPVLEKAIAGFDNTGSTDGFVIDATQYPQFVTINNTFRAIEAGEPLTPEMQKVFLEWMQALPESQRNAFGMLAEEYGVTVPKPSNKIDLTSIAKKPQAPAPAPAPEPAKVKTPQRLRYNEVIAEYAKSRGGSVFDGNSPTGRIAAQDAFKQVQKEFPWVRTFGDLDRQAPDILASPSKPAKSKDTITVDGKERPRTNSNGKPIHPTEEGTRAFWRWFGDSKVVDERGRPLVVYHGSPDMRFMGEDATFKSQAERFGGRGESTHAHWFASDTRTAKSYADDRRAYDYQNAEPGVIPAYLQALNPLVIDAQGQYWRDAQRRGQTADVIDEARADGHDGVIIRNVKDDYNNSKATKPTTTLTVFNPTQIKSATGNQGTFSPSNPSILASPTKPRPGAAPAPMVPLTPKPNGGAVPLDLQVDPLASAPGARAISIPEIERAIDDVYGRTHRGTAAKGADGSYSVSSGARWVRDGKFLVGIHEAGHQTSYQAQVIPHFTGPAMDELRSGYFDGTIPDNASQDTADQERFAEFFLAWHINPKLAGKVAPTLRKEFEAIMDAHDRALFKKMNDLSRLIRAYQGQNDVQLAAANFIPAESQSLPSKIAKALKSGTWEKVKDNLGLRLTDEYYPVLAAIDRIVGTSLRKGRELLGSKNPETWIRFIPYTSELLNDGLINGMVDWGVSFRTGKLTRSTGSIKDLFAPLKPKSPEFMSNYTTALGYIAALRQVHYDERLKMDAAAQVAEMQPKAAKKLADRIALAHAQIDRDLQIDLTNLAVQGKATKAATKMLIDAADARKDRATKALTTRSKAGLTRYRNMVLKEAAATAARSGIVAPGANGRTATDIAKGALASIASDPETKAMVEAFAAEIRRHGDWQLSMMEYSGRLSMEQAERIRQRNPYWFPIDRETSLDEDLDEALGFVAGQKIGNAKNVIREFRGSQKSMSDVVGALVKRNADVLAEFHRNMAARTMVDWVEDRGAIGGKAGVFHRVPTEVGIKPKDTQFFVWRNGEKETWEADPGNTAFVAAIKSFSGPRMEDTWERVFWMIFETPTQVNKAFVTNSLPFMVRNLWRDTVHASIKLGLNPIDVFRPKSDFVNQNYDALAIGLGRSTDIVSKSKWERNQAQMIKKASSEEMVIVRPYRVADDLRQESERTPRKAVFDREFKKHMATGHTEVESALMATVYTRNGMTDFRQGGTAVRALSRIVMFLNASVQGTRASLRAYRDDPVRTSLALAKYAGIWLAAEAAWAALGGEDEEKRLEKLDGYQRDMFWNFRIGGDNGWWLTIPKGHDEALGVGIIQRLALRVAGKDASHLQNTLNLARDTVLPMDDASDLFGGWLPSVELGFNRDFRTGKEIVPFYDQGPVHERSGTGYASTLGQALQRAFGNKVDARQWDHLIENSFGYYGRVTTSGSDSLRDGDTDALARAGIRFTGLNLPGRATGNATVLGVENYLRLWSKRPQAWSDAKGAFFDAKTEAERQEAGRKLIALAEKWHDKFESIKDRPKPARELILKTYFEAFKTPQ